MSAPSLDWMRQPPPLSGLTEEVLGTILHYLYAECLPTNLSELTARQCITAAQNIPGLEGLIKMCKIYLNNMALKQRKSMYDRSMHKYNFIFSNMIYTELRKPLKLKLKRSKSLEVSM